MGHGGLKRTTTLTQTFNPNSNPNRLVFTFTGAMVKTIILSYGWGYGLYYSQDQGYNANVSNSAPVTTRVPPNRKDTRNGTVLIFLKTV